LDLSIRHRWHSFTAQRDSHSPQGVLKAVKNVAKIFLREVMSGKDSDEK
jgi:hypothetical protein